MKRPAGSAVPPSDRGAGYRRPGVSHRSALRVGLTISLALHVLAVVAFSRLLQVPAGGPIPAAAPRAGGQAVQGMRVIRLREVETTGERPSAPAEVRRTEAPAVNPGVPDVSDTNRPGIVAPSPSAAERLRPHLSDSRLWAPLDPDLNELTMEQRIELELAGRITEWQDSMSAIADAQRALTDWTTTDSQGRKWGVSEGKLHLGGLTLPLPFSFGTPVGQRDAAARRAWEWEEIQRGAQTGAMRDSWKERAQAIRERRDKERAAQQKPDTSGVRR